MVERQIKEVMALVGSYNPKAIERLEQQITEILNKFAAQKEDEKEHKGETSLVHVLNVLKTLDTLLKTLKQEKTESHIAQLEQFLTQFPRLDRLLEEEGKPAGTHTREELLFFATLFHDVGKLYHFKGLEEKFEDAKKFKRHSFLGRWLFAHSEEKDLIQAQIEKNQAEVQKLEAKKDKWKESQALEYEERLQLVEILKEIKNLFDQYQKMFQELEFTKQEVIFMQQLIEQHMKWLEIFNPYEKKLIVEKYDETLNKQLNDQIKKLITSTADRFFESLLLSVSDMAGTANKGITENVFNFFNIVLKIRANPSKEFNLVTGDEIINEVKKEPYNFKAISAELQQKFDKQSTGRIMSLIKKGNPADELAKAKFSEEDIKTILDVIKAHKLP
jgi:hypothetical protein